MDYKDGSVKKEYVEAYKRHKGGNRKRRQSNTQQTSMSDSWKDSGAADPDVDSLAAAKESGIGDENSVTSS
jgi:hypothetical protein